jgi:hypothetical protein
MVLVCISSTVVHGVGNGMVFNGIRQNNSQNIYNSGFFKSLIQIGFPRVNPVINV